MLQSQIPGHDYTTITCAHCGRSRQIIKSCHDRFCPVCARVNARKIRKRLSYVLKNIKPRRGFSLSMLTLSTTNCEDLSEGIKLLVASFRKLRQSQSWKYYVSGGAMIIEITGQKGDWHPHFHILMYNRYYPREVLAKQWKHLTQGTAVYIKRVNSVLAMNYVTKYLTKSDVDIPDMPEASRELKKYRLFQRFGDWHKFKIPRSPSDCVCDHCGNTLWLTEWDIRRAEKGLYARRGS